MYTNLSASFVIKPRPLASETLCPPALGRQPLKSWCDTFIRFGDAQADSDLLRAIDHYKKLLLPTLSKKEDQDLQDLQGLLEPQKQRDPTQKFKKFIELVNNKHFPWQALPEVEPFLVNGIPDVQGILRYENYAIYPKTPYPRELAFAFHKGQIHKKSFQSFWLYDFKSKERHTEDDLTLYLGKDFNPLDRTIRPYPNRPKVFKMRYGNVWYTSNNTQVILEAETLMKRLYLISKLKLTVQDQAKAKLSKPPISYFNRDYELKRPVLLTNLSGKYSTH